MWRLILGQLRYSRGLLAGIYGVEVLLLGLFVVRSPDPSELPTTVWLLAFVAVAAQHQWMLFRDIREHRAVSWLYLPVRPLAWLGARIGLVAALVLGQAGVLLAAWALRAAVWGDLPFVDWAVGMSPFFAAVVFILFVMPFSEEIRAFFHPRAGLALAVHLVVFALFIALLEVARRSIPWAVLGGLALSLTLLGLTVWAQRRRDNFLVVPNLIGYKAKDLARAEGRFSTR